MHLLEVTMKITHIVIACDTGDVLYCHDVVGQEINYSSDSGLTLVSSKRSSHFSFEKAQEVPFTNPQNGAGLCRRHFTSLLLPGNLSDDKFNTRIH